jgi:hypothetical protein
LNVKEILPIRIKTARFIAIAADFLQIVLFPLFAPGFISPVDDALDVAVCFTLTWLVGWHYSFLPSFVVKVVPFADMVPCWTLAVFIATRQKRAPAPPVVTDIYAETVPPPQLKEPAKSAE